MILIEQAYEEIAEEFSLQYKKVFNQHCFFSTETGRIVIVSQGSPRECKVILKSKGIK